MEAEKKTGFDASKPFVVPILSGGEKRCEVRFPSDDEWCAWARAQRTLQPVEAWDTFRTWVERDNPRFAFSVARG